MVHPEVLSLNYNSKQWLLQIINLLMYSLSLMNHWSITVAFRSFALIVLVTARRCPFAVIWWRRPLWAFWFPFWVRFASFGSWEFLIIWFWRNTICVLKFTSITSSWLKSLTSVWIAHSLKKLDVLNEFIEWVIFSPGKDKNRLSRCLVESAACS